MRIRDRRGGKKIMTKKDSQRVALKLSRKGKRKHHRIF
jgi:hypothetical protein